jgi:hypothetical protein
VNLQPVTRSVLTEARRMKGHGPCIVAPIALVALIPFQAAVARVHKGASLRAAQRSMSFPGARSRREQWARPFGTRPASVLVRTRKATA